MNKKQERQEAIEYIKKHIKKGDTLYTKIVKVSPSGMSRQITVLDIKDNTPSYWSYYVSKILGYKLKDNGLGLLPIISAGFQSDILLKKDFFPFILNFFKE